MALIGCPLLLFFLAPVAASEFQDTCFKQVQKLAPYDFMLSSRLNFKVETLGTTSDFQEILEKLKEAPPANGNASACGPTTSYLAELFLGQEGELQLQQPGTTPDWKLVYGDKLVDLFREGAKKADHRFYYLATNAAVTQHVLSVEQLPAAGEQPVRFRVYQSAFDAYSLKAWLQEDPDKDALIKHRHVYGPQNSPDSFFHKKQNQFEGTNVCVMSPADDWPATMKKWMTSMMEFSDEDAYKAFEKAQSKYGGGRTITEEEMFGDDGFVTAVGRYTQSENDVVHTFPVEVYTKELQEMFEGAFGFPSIDQFVGVPVLTGLDTLRQLWDAGSAEKAAKSEKAKNNSSEKTETGILIASVAVDESKCEANAEIIMKSLKGVDPPSDGLAPSLKPETKEEVCAKKSSEAAAAGGDDGGESGAEAEAQEGDGDAVGAAGSVEEKFLASKKLLPAEGGAAVGRGTGGLMALPALLALAAALVASKRVARGADPAVEFEQLLPAAE